MRFHDLKVETNKSGDLVLTQVDCGEESVILVSRSQYLQVARQLLNLDEDLSHQVEELERKLSILSAELERYAFDGEMRKQLVDNVEYGFELLAKLDYITDLSIEFDGGRLLPNYPERKAQVEVVVDDNAQKGQRELTL